MATTTEISTTLRAVITFRPCTLGVVVFVYMKAPKIKVNSLRYFDITKHWKKLKPILLSNEAEHIWRSNMNEYLIYRAEQIGKTPQHHINDYDAPAVCDSCDWRWDRGHRHPQWWDFVCHSACHYLVDLNLYAAMVAFPKFQWRIVTQRQHSTVWNGDCNAPILFDMNFSAIGIPVKQAWEIASAGRMLKPHTALNWYRYGNPRLFESVSRRVV